MQTEWRSFQGGAWETEVNVRDFIQKNYHPYDGDDSFLEGPTQDTTDLWDQVLELSRQEREAGGVLDMDTKIISTITSHGPGYLDKEKEKIVGFQTDKPFKRALQPYGGIRMAVKACEDNGYKVDPEVVEYFTTHRKTHNAGVFDAYTPEMRACRSAHIITGLPDAYGRGRIIGDYRRPALYGVDRLIEDKKEQLNNTRTIMYSDVIREREELSEQIRALEMLKNALSEAENERDLAQLREELTQSGVLSAKQTRNKKMRGKPAQAKPFHYRTSDGFDVFAGKNNLQNDLLTLKTAFKSDIWFHTQKIHGSHVILVTDGREPTDEAMTEAAMIAAYHSRGRSSSLVPVDYTPVRQVKKPAGAKPGMVIYHVYQTAYVTPNEAEVEKLRVE